jgi:predicted porin
MKKSLFAIAAVTAFAGAAQAQSSVTVYGILDVGYVGGNAKATAKGVNSAETISRFDSSAESSSRLGFRGTETLGGGTTAFFTFETGLNPNASTLSSFNTRQAFVGLSQKGLGRGAIGTQNTPIHVAVGRTSAGQHNNIVGDVIYPQNSGLTNNGVNSSNANAGYTVRTNNTLSLQSENISGFQATAFYALANKDQSQITNPTTGAVTGGNTNVNGWGIGLNYTLKKLLVTANYQSLKNQTDAGSPPATTVTTGASTNASDNQMYFAATYDFGILKAYAQYIDRKWTSTLNSSNYAKRSAQQLGVRGNWTPKIESWASIGTGRNQVYGAGEPTANFTGWQLGTNYILSKRTNLYAIYGTTNTSSVSSIGSSANNSYSGNNYALGVRHTF